MRRAERIVFALAALGEARKPAALPDRADTVAPAGEDLVGIGLMANVPDQPVIGCVEHVVDRHGQFDHAKARAEVPARLADGRDHFRAQFIGQLSQLGGIELAKFVGRTDIVEKRCGRIGGHALGLTLIIRQCRLTAAPKDSPK